MTISTATEDQVVRDLVEHEGNTPWPYCDRRGNVTIGVGHLVATPDALAALPLVHLVSGIVATDEEKRFAWLRTKEAYDRDAGAIRYRHCSTVRLNLSVALVLCRERLRGEFLPALERTFPDLSLWPSGAVRAVFDIQYNCGAFCYRNGWTNFVAACKAKKWDEAIKHCTRADARRPPTPEDPEGLGRRNLWTIARLKEAIEETQQQQRSQS